MRRQRWQLLAQITALTEKPLIALAMIWLVLVIVDITVGLSTPLLWVNYVIWGIFIVDFVMRLIIAPDRWRYLRSNWLTALSLAVPALRIFRALQFLRAARALRLARAAQVARSATLVRVLGSVNRSVRATRQVMRRRGLGYVITLTIIVVFAGAAGMRYFENTASLRDRGYIDASTTTGLNSYGEALWWTAMMITTMGTDYWPRTNEGRLLCFMRALYAFAIFGYITATIASIFIGQDAATNKRKRM